MQNAICLLPFHAHVTLRGRKAMQREDDDCTKYWLFVLTTMRWSTVRRRYQVVLLSVTHDRSTHGSFRSWRAGIRVFGTFEQSGVTCVGLSNTTVFGTFYA